MKFEIAPKLILTKDEFEILDGALKLCRDMDEETSQEEITCEICPFQDNCSHMYVDCVYARAHRALKEIIDVAIVK